MRIKNQLIGPSNMKLISLIYSEVGPIEIYNAFIHETSLTLTWGGISQSISMRFDNKQDFIIFFKEVIQAIENPNVEGTS